MARPELKDDPIILLLEKRDRDNLFGPTFVNLVMITFGAFLIYDEHTANRVTDYSATVGWVLIVLFGCFTLNNLRFSFAIPPTLIATVEGILIKTDFNPTYGPIEWAEIHGFDFKPGYDGEGDKLRIHLAEPMAVFKRLGQWPKFAFIDRRPSDPIDVPGGYFGRDVDEVAADLALIWQQQMPDIEVYDPKDGIWRAHK